MASLPPPREGQRETGAKERAKEIFAEFRAQLNSKTWRASLTAMVPSEFRSVGYVDRIIEGAYGACRDNPDLLVECDRASMFRELERAAKACVPIGNGYSYLVPYKRQVQWQLGYKGAMLLVRRSGVVRKFTAQVIYENDRCAIRLGTDASVDHQPEMRSGRGEPIGVYAAAWLKGEDDPEIEYMSASEIQYIRGKSPSQNSPAWRDWWGEMARVKVLKRLAKRLPTEREIDLSDMDDRMGETIEGVAEPIMATLAAPTEQAMPMDQFDADEREPAPTQREQPREQQQQRQTQREPEPRDDDDKDGGRPTDDQDEDDQRSYQTSREPDQTRGQVPPPRGGPRRSGGNLFSSGG